MTDPIRTPHPWIVVQSLPAGWGVVYRHFGAANRYSVAARMVAVARRRKIAVLIAADPDLARRANADGVHWPQNRLPSRVRRLRPGGIVTAAAHDRAAIRRALIAGADAAVVSPVFATDCDGAREPFGPRRYRLLVKDAHLPCYGLGGVTATAAARIANAGRIASVHAVRRAFAPL